MKSFNDLIDSDPLERDPHEHGADDDAHGIENDEADSDTDSFDDEADSDTDSFDDDTIDTRDRDNENSDQPDNEKPKTINKSRRRKQTRRDDEDTNLFDDVDEESDLDEENEYDEVNDRDEEDAASYINPEPLIYQAQFYAQEVVLPDPDIYPEDAPEPELTLDDFELERLDADAFYNLAPITLLTDDFVQLEPDDLSDPLAAFRWFDAEDIFVEPYTD